MSFDDDLERAWSRLEQGDVAGARRAAEKLSARVPDSADALVLLAACAREEGATEGARSLLERAAAADPSWATPPLWLAELDADNPERLEQALAHAERALARAEGDERFEAAALKAGIEIDLGRRDEARRTLEALPSAAADPPPPAAGLELASLWLELGDAAEARRRFQAVVDEDPQDADAWHGLGIAAEEQGDEAAKRKAWLETLALDRRARLDDADALLPEAAMAEVAEQALAELPERARALLRDVPIVIADLPARKDVERGLDPRLLGLFEGSAYPDTPSLGGSPHLTQILLFRRNLERVAADPDELREQVRITLLHETGHFFGMSEEDLAEVGLD